MPLSWVKKDEAVGSSTPTGQWLKITATSIGSPQDVHTPPSAGQRFDYLYVWARSSEDSEMRFLTLLWGGTATDDAIKIRLMPGRPPLLASDALPLRRGRGLKAFADVADKVYLLVRLAGPL